MKSSTRKRLEALERAATMHEIHQLVILDVRTFSDIDREAYWAGDEGVLRRYGAPARDNVPLGQIRTIVIDVPPHLHDPELAPAGVQDEDSEQ